MSEVTFKRVEKRYGPVVALEALDLTIQEGEFLTLLGPSGCGKTTTLRLIAGFLEPTSGQILIDGEDVTAVAPQKRSIGMVFQDYALFPHLTVAENIGFGLKERRVPSAKIRQRVAELLELIQLPHVATRYPAELSGGQQQRVALARAVAHTPRVLLMDEPLGALDLKLREAMQIEIRRVQQELGVTTVYVTHDQNEAMNLSDRIAVMNLGRLVQLGTAEEIYNRPATKFVAGFVGRINFLSGCVTGMRGSDLMIDSCGHLIAARGSAPVGANVAVALRPEHIAIAQPGADDRSGNHLAGEIVSRTFSGNLATLIVRTAANATVMVEERPDAVQARVGDRVDLVWDPRKAAVLADT